MDYEKAYKEALERAKDSFSYPSMPGFMRVDVIFPELKESEDERIRKGLIARFKTMQDEGASVFGECYIYAILAWLEKHKPVESVLEDGIEDESVYDTEDKIMLKAIAEGICYLVDNYGWSDFGGIAPKDILAWVDKQYTVEQDKDIQDEYDRKYNEGKAVGIEIGKDEMRKQLSAKWDEEDEKPYLRT